MSYILDALKKSDQERQRGTVPNLQTVQMPLARESQRRSRWTLVIALALLLNAGLLVWWFRPWQAEPPKAIGRSGSSQQAARTDNEAARDAAAVRPLTSPPDSGTTKKRSQEHQEPAKQSSAVTLPTPAPSPPKRVGAARETRQESAKAEAATKAATPKVPTEDAKAGRDNAPARSKSGQGSERSAGEPIRKVDSGKQKTDAMQSAAKEQKPEAQERTVTKLTVPPEVKETPGVPGTATQQGLAASPLQTSGKEIPPGTQGGAEPGVSKRSPGAQPSAERGQPQPPPSSQPSAEQGLPEARELPLTVQRDLPNMSVSMVIYSEKPGDRMININGRMMREGQEVSPGLKVEQITPNGAVLKFQGHRFRKGVL